ncbi:HAD family hydrolase [Janibacter anophelis]|uniref:HAD family hydrolase n=1 Tax=Janibacter anophelis TaxID=319054 RepID=UPI003F7E05F2
MEPHLVALDVDGTILTHDGQLRPATREAVRAVADAGHHVVISTGRSAVATVPVLEMLDLTHGWAVCSNGAVTLELTPDETDGYRVAETVTFDPREALTLVMDHAPHILVAVEQVGVGFKVVRPYPEGVLQGEQVVVPFEELVSGPTTRVTFHDPEGASEDFLELVERIGLHGVSYAVGYTAWLDLAPEGVSKGSALELVRRRLAVEPHLTFAAGDQRNDLEMLRWAARGVAMGDAPPEVVAAADEQTGTVHEDGLAAALRPYL